MSDDKTKPVEQSASMESVVMRLSRRKRELLMKFQMGYYAVAERRKYTATLYPGENVECGKRERVRTDTLEEMVAGGLLVESQDISPVYGVPGDITWRHPRFA